MTDEHDNTLFIELPIDGSYWNVNSGGIFRKGYSDKKETVVKTEPQQPNNAASTSSSLSVDEVEGIATTEPNGEPTVSASKDTQSVSTVQTDRKEISEKSAESNVEVTNEEVVSLPKNEGEQALFSLSAEEQSIIDAAKAPT